MTDEVEHKLQEIGGFKDRNDIILTGIGGHICVLQTALNLINKGYNVHLGIDDLLRQSSAVLTTSYYQLLGDAKQRKFKETQAFVMILKKFKTQTNMSRNNI